MVGGEGEDKYLQEDQERLAFRGGYPCEEGGNTVQGFFFMLSTFRSFRAWLVSDMTWVAAGV